MQRKKNKKRALVVRPRSTSAEIKALGLRVCLNRDTDEASWRPRGLQACPKSQAWGGGRGLQPPPGSPLGTRRAYRSSLSKTETDRRRSEGEGRGGRTGRRGRSMRTATRELSKALGWLGVGRAAGGRLMTGMCVHTAGSRRSAGTNMALPGNYTPI